MVYFVILEELFIGSESNIFEYKFCVSQVFLFMIYLRVCINFYFVLGVELDVGYMGVSKIKMEILIFVNIFIYFYQLVEEIGL